MDRASWTVLLAAMLASGHCEASNYTPSDLSNWTAYGDSGKQSACALLSTAVHDTPAQEHPDLIRIILVWRPGQGTVLSLNGRFSANPSVRLESVGTSDAWDVTLALPEGGMAARQVVLDTSRIDALLRNVGLGAPLAVTVTESGKPPIRHETSAIYARIAVPIYRACVASLTTEPAQDAPGPRHSYSQPARDGGCGFSQSLLLERFPASVTLWVDDHGAEMRFTRSTLEGEPHGGFERRRKPDLIDARRLFGETFQMLEQNSYAITAGQLAQLSADLARGASRDVTLTEPDGAKWTLAFGGPQGKTTAAMFEACREATFSAR